MQLDLCRLVFGCAGHSSMGLISQGDLHVFVQAYEGLETARTLREEYVFVPAKVGLHHHLYSLLGHGCLQPRPRLHALLKAPEPGGRADLAPAQVREVYLAHALETMAEEHAVRSAIVFCATCRHVLHACACPSSSACVSMCSVAYACIPGPHLWMGSHGHPLLRCRAARASQMACRRGCSPARRGHLLIPLPLPARAGAATC